MKRKKYVYVAGPYSGDVRTNVISAVMAGYRLRGLGLDIVPVIPHLFYVADEIQRHSYDYWMDWDADLLAICDAVYRSPGDSPGADKEVALAIELDLPVFHDVVDCISWACFGVDA